MRILHVVTVGEPGGAQSVVRTLAEGAVAAGVESAIAYGAEAGEAAWTGMDGSVERIPLPSLVRAVRPLKEIAALKELAAVAGAWRPDIVHLHTSKAAALGRLARGVRRDRVVYTMHGYDQLRVAHRKLLPVDRALRGRCAAVVAVSEYDRAAMRADGYEPLLIPNGVPDALALARPDTPAARLLEGMRASGRPVALLVAREAQPKRIDLAREAARLLDGRAVIAWIGGDPKAGDPPGFLALGALSEAAAYLRLADMALLPSDHEGAPMSVLEAMSAGIPVAASAVGGVPELLGLGTGEARGIGVPNDPRSFAEAIIRLAGDAAERKALGAAGREAWERRYSAARMAQAYLALYRE